MRAAKSVSSMEKMNVLDVIPMMETQQQLDSKFLAKSEEPRTLELVWKQILAVNVELSEFLNEWGGFKHWKHSHTVDRDKLLEEAADVFCFLFSIPQIMITYDFNNEQTRKSLQDAYRECLSYIEQYYADDISSVKAAERMNKMFANFSQSTMAVQDLIDAGGGETQQAQMQALMDDLLIRVLEGTVALHTFCLYHLNIRPRELEKAYSRKVDINQERIAGDY